MHRIIRSLSPMIVAACVLVAGCSETSGPSARPVNQLPSLLVSSPESGSASASASVDVVGGIGWVSLPPGSVSDGGSATIRNGRSGADVTVALVDGGFDPVAIAVSVDDTVFVDITRTANEAPLTGFQVIAIRKAPSVVRTSPPRGKTDVPLNAAIVVVFSAPIDVATLSPSSFGLLRGGAPISGSVRAVGTGGISAEFYPDSALAPQTSYQLFVTQAIHDVNGAPLANAVTDTFSTGTTVSTDAVSVANSTLSASQDSTWDQGKLVLITLTLRDSSNHQIPHGGATFAINSTAGYIVGVTDHADGTYTATLSPPTLVGSAVVSATVDGLPVPSTCTVRFVAVPSGPVSLAQSGASQGDSVVLADGASTTSVVVWLRDANGHPIQNLADSITVTTTLGSLGGVTGGANGVYGATLTAPAVVGKAIVTARIGNLTLGSFSVRFALHQLWVRKARMPFDFANAAAAPVDATVYVAGGWWRWTDESQPLGTGNELYAYDPVANAWTQRASMPGNRAALAMASINGILYAVGGYGDQQPASNSVYAYDPRADHWKVLAPMPTARARLALAVAGGILYAVGGESSPGTAPLQTVEAYDPSTDHWTTKASMPTARAGVAASVVDGILYAAGGDASPNPDNALEAYDPATDSWSTRASMPRGSKGLAAVALGERLFAVGTDSSATFQQYDPAKNSWSVLATSPIDYFGSTYGIVASLANGSIFVVGGFGDAAMWVP